MKFFTKYNFYKPKVRKLSRDNNVDELAFTPIHVQIQRMIDSGSNLMEYRRKVNAMCLYSKDEVDDNDNNYYPVYKPDMAEAQKIYDNAVTSLEDAKSVANKDLTNNSEVTEKSPSEKEIKDNGDV